MVEGGTPQEPSELQRIGSEDARWDGTAVSGASGQSRGFQGWTKVSFGPLHPSTEWARLVKMALPFSELCKWAVGGGRGRS